MSDDMLIDDFRELLPPDRHENERFLFMNKDTTLFKVRNEFEKAWDELSADDPEESPLGQENEEEPSGQDSAEEDIPTIEVKPEDSEKE